jgi:5-methyltetrahydropteroyltriglutamate--homocysteine methyltransferase
MPRTDSDRILTTHAGSLPRPKSLTALHAAKFAGEAVDEEALAKAVEDATRASIAMQLEAGLDIVNNGEAGRESFFTYVQHRMSGFGGTSQRRGMGDVLRYPAYLERLVRTAMEEQSVSLMSAPRATGEVRYVSAAPIEAECRQLRGLLDEVAGRFSDAFVSSPSPGIVAAAMENAYYDDLETYVDALAEALRTEYAAIVAAGFLLQIDAPDLAMERHTLFQERTLEEFLDFARTVVAAINRALEGIPRDRVRLHVCWGNYEGPHDLDVPLADIWPVVSETRAGAFLLSMANPRHAHEYRLFESVELPEGALVVPGVIDTTTNYVEHPEAVADRIERVARAVGDPRRVVAGTDCGFETSAGFASVTEDVVWPKLRSLAEGAALASRRLFG